MWKFQIFMASGHVAQVSHCPFWAGVVRSTNQHAELDVILAEPLENERWIFEWSDLCRFCVCKQATEGLLPGGGGLAVGRTCVSRGCRRRNDTGTPKLQNARSSKRANPFRTGSSGKKMIFWKRAWPVFNKVHKTVFAGPMLQRLFQEFRGKCVEVRGSSWKVGGSSWKFVESGWKFGESGWKFVEVRGSAWKNFLQSAWKFVEVRGKWVEVRGKWVEVRGSAWEFVGARCLSACVFHGSSWKARGSAWEGIVWGFGGASLWICVFVGHFSEHRTVVVRKNSNHSRSGPRHWKFDRSFQGWKFRAIDQWWIELFDRALACTPGGARN